MLPLASMLQWFISPVSILDQTNQPDCSIPVSLILLSNCCLTKWLLQCYKHSLQRDPFFEYDAHLSLLLPIFGHLHLMEPYVVPFVPLHLVLYSFLFEKWLCIFDSISSLFVFVLHDVSVEWQTEVGVVTSRVSHCFLLLDPSDCAFALLNLSRIFLNALNNLIESDLFHTPCTNAQCELFYVEIIPVAAQIILNAIFFC